MPKIINPEGSFTMAGGEHLVEEEEEEDLLGSCSRDTFFSKSAESQPSQHQMHFDKNLIWGFIYVFEARNFKKFL